MMINLQNYESYLLDYIEGNLPKELLVDMEFFLASHPDIASQIEDYTLPKISSNEIKVPSFSNLNQSLVWDEKEVESLLLNSLENQLEKNDLKRLAQFSLAFSAEVSSLEKLISATELTVPEEGLPSSFLEDLKQVDFASKESKIIAFVEGDLNAKDSLKLESEVKSNPQLAKTVKLYSATKLVADGAVNLPADFKAGLERKESGIIIPIWFKRAAVAAAVIFGLFLLPFSGEEITAYEPRTEDSSVAEYEYEELESEGENYGFKTGGLRSAVIPMITPDSSSKSNFDVDVFLAAYDEVDSTPEPTVNPQPTNKPRPRVLEPMSFKSQVLASAISSSPKVINHDYIIVDLETYEWDDSELAELDPQPEDGVSVVEYAENKTKESLGEEDEQSLALAFVNSGAKKLLNSDKDVLVYEKDDNKGFKFSLGKFSVERIK